MGARNLDAALPLALSASRSAPSSSSSCGLEPSSGIVAHHANRSAPAAAIWATMRQSDNSGRASGSGSIAVAGAQVASTPSVSRAVFLSHTSRCRTMRKWPTPTAATGPTCNGGASRGAAQSASMLTGRALACAGTPAPTPKQISRTAALPLNAIYSTAHEAPGWATARPHVSLQNRTGASWKSSAARAPAESQGGSRRPHGTAGSLAYQRPQPDEESRTSLGPP